ETHRRPPRRPGGEAGRSGRSAGPRREARRWIRRLPRRREAERRAAARSQGREVPLRLRNRVRDEDCVLLADGLAEPAGDAGAGVHLRDLVEGLVEGVVDQVDAVEGADVDAELAAGAEIPVHDSLGNLLRFDLLDELALLVLDAGNRAIPGADRAVDAPVVVNDVLLALVAR